MPDRRRTPSFKRPPVIEVALGVQFDEPLPLRFVDYGHVWDLYRERYPEYQEQAPLATVVESFGDEPRPAAEQVMNAAAFPRAPFRLWFSDGAAGGLVQIQQDRFVFNWRKLGDGATYPRFSWVKGQFEAEFRILLRFLEDLGVNSPTVSLCEVTYVNHILAGEGWTNHADLHAVFPSLRVPQVSVEQAAAEEADVRIRFGMVGLDGQAGRLHLRAYPAVRTTDDAKLFVVNLNARRRPAGAGVPGVLEALHDGHDWIVFTFKDITSDAMHRVWGLEDA